MGRYLAQGEVDGLNYPHTKNGFIDDHHLNHRWTDDGGLVVTGGSRFGVARALLEAWSGLGHETELFDDCGQATAELWGTPLLSLGTRPHSETRLLELISSRRDLLTEQNVWRWTDLDAAIRPPRRMVVVSQHAGGVEPASEATLRLAGVVGVHLLHLEPWAHEDTERTHRGNRCAVLDTGVPVLQPSGRDWRVEQLTGVGDVLGRGTFTPDQVLRPHPAQAATAPTRPLPDGWSPEDLRLASVAGLTVAEITAATPDDDLRAMWQMLAGLQGPG